MPDRTKIATCCYCGRRTMLQLTARDGHELACGACGAPLHEMKHLPVREGQAQRRSAVTAQTERPIRSEPRKRRKPKRRTPMWKKALEEAFDMVEDIFD